MVDAHLIGVSFALLSAMGYGVADFCGGRAARLQSPFQVLALSGITGWVILAGFVVGTERMLPTLASSLWAAGAGGFGALGIAAFYRALAIGRSAVVAPTATVVGTMLPFLFGLLTIGWPTHIQLVGLVFAITGVGLVSRSGNSDNDGDRKSLVLAVLAGFGFAGFFILIAHVEDQPFFAPLLVARSITIVLALTFIRWHKLRMPSPTGNPLALWAGILDVTGNICFMLAQQFTRMDLAAVLVGLCPAVTVVLSRILLKEIVSPTQWIGVLFCVLSLTLISI